MSIATKKLQLIDQLMKIGEEKTLARVEELLIRAEMEARAEESIQAIKDGNVISLEQFGKDCEEWLKARRVMKRQG